MGKSMKLGGGGRFAALEGKLASKPGVTDPGALAASIGRKKYGAPKMASMAAKGKAKSEAGPTKMSSTTAALKKASLSDY